MPFEYKSVLTYFLFLVFCVDRQFDFMGKCDIMVLAHPTYGNGKGLRMHARSENANQTYAWNTAVAVLIGSDILEMDTSDMTKTKFYWNKVETEFNLLPDNIAGYPINYEGTKDRLGYANQYVASISLEKGDVLELRAIGRYSDMGFLRYSNNLRDSYGMLGNFRDELYLLRNGTNYGFPGVSQFFAFGQNWQVNSSEPMIFHDAQAPQFPARCTQPAPGGRAWFSQDAALKHCKDRGALAHLLDLCAYDVFLTGDPNIALLYDGKARRD
jgi:hypothetical protein